MAAARCGQYGPPHAQRPLTGQIVAAGENAAAKVRMVLLQTFGTLRIGTRVTGGRLLSMISAALLNGASRSELRAEAQGKAAQKIVSRHRPLAGALYFHDLDGTASAGNQDPLR